MKLFFKVKLFEIKEFFYSLKLCLVNKRFFLPNLLFRLSYLFSNPYHMSRKFLQKRGFKDVYQYGETPLSTFQKIIKELDLTKDDFFLDLGCGRGLGLFWINTCHSINTVGVDFQYSFIKRARWITLLSRLQKLVFLKLDFKDVDLSQFTAVYFYGITLNEKQIISLTKKFESMKPGSRVITISSPLSSERFIVQKCFSVEFNWGKTTAYLNLKKN